MIRLETSKRTGIDNTHDRQISYFDRNVAKDYKRLYPNIERRTTMSAAYNCHGLTFASRRTHITAAAEILKILADDSYKVIEMKDVLPGDIVVYWRDDDANHSGVVVEYKPGFGTPIIFSKWGVAGEYIHALRDCPQAYGPEFRFYRCCLV